MPTRDIIRGSDPEISSKKIYEDKIKYLDAEMSDFFTYLKEIVGYRLDRYMENLEHWDHLPGWLSDHYDESPTFNWVANTPYENVDLLNWISYSDEDKIQVLDDELEAYFRE